MATPPVRTEISDTYPNPTNAVARTGFGKLYDYVTGLLGSTGNSAEARVALSAAKLGANSDITSLSAITTPLSVAQGGSGASSASVARSNLGVAWELLGSATASSSATVDFTGINGSLYSSFMIELNEIASGTNNVSLVCRISTGSGFLLSGYNYGAWRWTNSASGVDGTLSGTSFVLSTNTELHGTGLNQRASYMITIHGADSTVPTKRVTWTGSGLFASGSYVHFSGGGEVDTNSAPIDGIRFLMASGVILSGTIRLYGLKNT